MPLSPGTRFGPYSITGLIGAGGMGEVYRARDTKLDRDVALKVLGEDFTSLPDRLARFEREARTLASLNHPHIAHVYGLEDRTTVGAMEKPGRALVMELVEGEDLTQRIARGPLAVGDVVAIARQVVGALATAHEHGIVHRDLKPANIRVTADGTVKVLDFGLAKTLDGAVSAANPANSPTVTGTLQGIILGTAAYMSPEQARGQAVDARTDVWAFGCVLYEMLTGRPAFLGPSTSDTVARILEREPDWDALPLSTPASLRRLLARCLEKDAKRRLHAIADAQFEIEDALAGNKPASAPAVRATRSGAGRWVLGAGIVAVLLAIAAWQYFPKPAADLPPRVMSLTSNLGIEASPSFSPDGTQVAFSWDGEKGDNEDIYVLIVGSDSPHPITKNAARDVSPAWRPDRPQIAFARVDDGRAGIYLVSPLGGSEQKLVDFSAIPVSGGGGPIEIRDPRLSWSADGRWLAVSRVTAGADAGVFLVSASDGSVRRLLAPARPSDEYRMAVFSPTGTELALINGGFIEVVRIASTDPPAVSGTPRRVSPILGFVSGLAWSADGRQLFFGRAQYPSPNPPYLWSVPAAGDRAPERIDLAGVAGYPAVSALGHRLAFVRRGLNEDLLLLREGQLPEPLLASTSNEQDPSFSPDGSKIAFATDRNGEGNEIWVAQTADASTRRPVTRRAHRSEGSPRWSPDGRRLAFDGLDDDGVRHVYLVDEAGGPIHAVPFRAGSFDQIPSWSHDGHWIYFGSNRSGRVEVWRWPVTGGNPEQVTTTGGNAPLESWDGRTIYYFRTIDGVSTVFEMPVGGGRERPLGITTSFWNYVPTREGLCYVSTGQGQRAPYLFEVRCLDTATGKSRVIYSLRLAAAAPGLTVLPDGKTVLTAGVAEITQDLMRIENFR